MLLLSSFWFRCEFELVKGGCNTVLSHLLATVLCTVVSAGAPPMAATMRWAVRDRRIAEVNLRKTVDA